MAIEGLNDAVGGDEGGRLSNFRPVRTAGRKRLSQAEQRTCVQLFAHFNNLADVQRILEEMHGIVITKQALARYDPNSARCRLPPTLMAYFQEHRARYLADVEAIGIAHQGHRLHMLHRMAQAAEKKGQFGTAAQLLKQAAEEMGGLLTNERKVNVTTVHLSLADAKAELANRLSALVEEQALLPAPQQGEDAA